MQCRAEAATPPNPAICWLWGVPLIGVLPPPYHSDNASNAYSTQPTPHVTPSCLCPGGYTTNYTDVLASVEVYDPNEGTWTEVSRWRQGLPITGTLAAAAAALQREARAAAYAAGAVRRARVLQLCMSGQQGAAAQGAARAATFP